jgi:predicted protein tyrosine phosphatase
MRSPTAERVFSRWPGLEVASAGVGDGANNPVTPELIAWADVIFVMEQRHADKLSRDFLPHLKTARVICLGIRDRYSLMDPNLVRLLRKKVPPFLR